MIDNEGKKQLKSINRQELELNKKMKDQKEQLRKKLRKKSNQERLSC